MSLQQGNDSDAEEYHSLPGHDDEGGAGDSLNDAASEVMEPPIHPVPSMQGAFEESITESTEDNDSPPKAPSDDNPDVRRRMLLEAHRFDPSWKTRWKQRPNAQHHPLRKLMAQILFGMHLLQQNQAKSNEEVVKILQTHVDEVDTFLERTGEDFDCAIADIDERIHHLELPMAHLDVFKSMLADKDFRTQLLSGNDKIEKIVDRTARATYAALADVHQGIGSNRELGKYLDTTEDLWPQEDHGIADVCPAMRGNEQGWMNYLEDLLVKGDNLNKALVQLSTITGEMSRLAASASRRNKSINGPMSSSTSKSNVAGLRSKFYRDKSTPASTNLNKPLPREPRTVFGGAHVVPKQHPVPFAERYESPRARVPAPHTPSTKSKQRVAKDAVAPKRPRTAGSVSRENRNSSAELAEFLKNSGPLRSNPPEYGSKGKGRAAPEKLGRSQSQSAAEIFTDIQKLNHRKEVRKSKSQTALFTLNREGANQSESGTNNAANQGAENLFNANEPPTGRKESAARRLSLAFRGRDHRSESAGASNTGFTRRLSKRAKVAPAPPPSQRTQNHPQQNPMSDQSPPMDSAYSSGTDKKAPLDPEAAMQQESTPDRPPSRLSLFPKQSPPLTRPVASIPKRSGSLGANALLAGPASPTSLGPQVSPTPAPAREPHQRTLSLRNIFHRRNNTTMA